MAELLWAGLCTGGDGVTRADRVLDVLADRHGTRCKLLSVGLTLHAADECTGGDGVTRADRVLDVLADRHGTRAEREAVCGPLRRGSKLERTPACSVEGERILLGKVSA